MKIETAGLTGAALDWAVAVAEGEKFYGPVDFKEQRCYVVTDNREYRFRYHQSWAQMGPIIARQHICVECEFTDGHIGVDWFAYIYGQDRLEDAISGETPLIAAARCYVASKLGTEIEIPKELWADVLELAALYEALLRVDES